MFIDLTGVKWREDYSYSNFSRYKMDEVEEGIMLMQASGVSEHGGRYLGEGVVSGLAFPWRQRSFSIVVMWRGGYHYTDFSHYGIDEVEEIFMIL